MLIHLWRFSTFLSPLRPSLFLSPIRPSPSRVLLHNPSILLQTAKSLSTTAQNAVHTITEGSDDTFFANDDVLWGSIGVSEKLACSLSNAGFNKPSLIQYPRVSICQLVFRDLVVTSRGREKGNIFVRCYSTKKSPSKKRKSSSEAVMEDDKDAFFVVRKGDIVGVYKNLSECQAQVSSSICDPPVSVYKGHSFPKDAEEYLLSRGLQNAMYTIKASDLNDDIFGKLMPCPFQDPSSKGEASSMDFPQKRLYDMTESGNVDVAGLSKLQKLEHISSDDNSCIIEFDGASKGTGLSGAGVVLRSPNGNMICKIRQGLGIATNNAAEYRAVILGLKKALEMGYTSIQAKGDSKLVCMQLQGLWRVKHPNITDLHAEAKKLKDRFNSFHISHVLRHLNADADAQANLAVCLPDGQVQQDFC